MPESSRVLVVLNHHASVVDVLYLVKLATVASCERSKQVQVCLASLHLLRTQQTLMLCIILSIGFAAHVDVLFHFVVAATCSACTRNHLLICSNIVMPHFDLRIPFISRAHGRLRAVIAGAIHLLSVAMSFASLTALR